MKDLWGRSALLTGASRGIGVHIARALASEGMNLVLAARTASGLEAVAAGVEGMRRKALVLPTDLGDREQVRALAEKAESAFGGIDVLVNNAAIEVVYDYRKLTEAEIDEGIEVNLRAPMQLTRLLLPGMLERRRGFVVNVSSLAGKAGPGFNEVYATTKAALIGFTRSLRASYTATGVSASVICPGFVDDGMYQRAKDETGLGAPSVLGVARAEDVAQAVVRSIRRDAPEVIVNPLPVRPLLALAELAPGLAEKIARRIGADRLFQQGAEWQEQHGRFK